MKQFFISFFGIVLLWPLLSPAQEVKGSGQLSTTSHAVDNFTGIRVSGAFVIELTQGEGYGVQVITDENLQPLVNVSVREGLLYIETDRRLQDPSELKVFIRSDVFAQLELNGAVDLSSTTPLYGESLHLKINGASTVDLALAYEQVKSEISGAGDLKLIGEATTVVHEVSGASSISAYALEADRVTVDISGTGSAQVFASAQLVAEISGTGSITYDGSPSVVKNISGLGSLARR